MSSLLIANFKKIINPPKDFLIWEDLRKNKKHVNKVYEKIYQELLIFCKERLKTKITESSFKNKHGKISFKTKKYEYVLEFNFYSNNINVLLNGFDLGDSMIYGAFVDKEKLIVSNIKVDLTSFKKQIHELVN